MAGYNLYSGVGGSPYYAGMGQNASMTPNTGFGQPAPAGGGGGGGIPAAPAAAPAVDPTTVGNGMGGPSQMAMQPGSFGNAGYASGMPQWMQDYFDANVAGQGFESLDQQRNLAVNELPYLQQQYGAAALNPYFAANGAAKGFDPFKNNFEETVTGSYRAPLPGYEEVAGMHDWETKTHNVRNPFTGDIINSNSYSYMLADRDKFQNPYTAREMAADLYANPFYGQAKIGAHYLKKWF